MSSIDNRVVSMKFDNAQFEKGVKQTTDSLKKLDDGLNMKNGAKGLTDIASAIKGLTFNSISDGVSNISSRFTALGIVGVTALANIANQAINTGISMGKSLTVDPIMEGFSEYELKMGSIQTILANTSRHGTSLETVNAELDKLNKYADKTIYNFGDMTKNVGLFTNSGMKVEDATTVIKGFSNEAAASGTNATQAAGAAYQLSQALNAGTVRLMDWKSLQTVGMGNKNMQDGLVQLAEAMGAFNGKGIDAAGVQKDFNASLEKGWLSSDVMSTYLKIMSGDMDDASIAALGLNESQVKQFRAQQQMAEEAATKVRTFTQLFGTLKEAVGSGWSETFQILFGDFNEATDLFTGVSESLGGIIGGMSDARNALAQGWKDLGGRTELITALGNVFNFLLSIIKTIGSAFTEIFPPVTAQTLYELTVNLRKFTDTLKLGSKESEGLKNTFKGVFAIFDIFLMILSGAAKAVFSFFGVIAGGTGGVLSFTGSIGELIVQFRDFLKSGKFIENFFSGLGGILQIIGGAVLVAGHAFKALFNYISGKPMDFNLGPLPDILDRVGDRFKNLAPIIKKVFSVLHDIGAGAVQGVVTVFNLLFNGNYDGGAFSEDSWIVDKLLDIRDAVKGFIKNIGDIFTNGINWDTLLDGINTGIFVGLFLLVRKFLKGDGGGEGGGLLESLGITDLVDSIKSVFGGLTDTLSSMQQSLKASVLLQIAAAIGILAISLMVIASIDSNKLTVALAAIAALFTQLILAMGGFTKVVDAKSTGKLVLLGFALIGLAIAVDILVIAVKALSKLSWEELGKGLAGLAGILLILVGTSKLLDGSVRGMIKFGAALILMSVGLNLLVSVVRKLSEFSWDELLRGLAGLAGVMLIISGATRLMNPSGILKSSVAMIAMGYAVGLMADSISTFSDMNWEELGRGLTGLAGALLILSVATRIMGGSFTGTVALLGVVAALWVLVPLLQTMGSMKWSQIAKAGTVLAGSLAIIAGGLYIMTGAIAGAASMLIVVAGLWVLVPLLVELGDMSWNSIAKAAVILAASLAIIAGGMYLMTGIIAGAASMLVAVAALWVLVPLLVELGNMSWESIIKASVTLAASLAIIAGGMYLMTGAIAGAAAMLIVSAALAILTPVLMTLSTLSWGELLIGLTALAGAFTVIGVAGLLLTPVIPSIMLLSVAIGLLGIAAMAAGAGMLMFGAGFAIFVSSIVSSGSAILGFIDELVAKAGTIGAGIGTLIVSIITTIANSTGEIYTAATNMIQTILKAVNDTAPMLYDTIKLLLHLLVDTIIEMAPEFTKAAVVVINCLLAGIRATAPNAVNTLVFLIDLLLTALQNNMPKFMNKGVNIILSIVQGINNNMSRMVNAGVTTVVNFLNGVANNMGRIVTAGVNIIVNFLNGIAQNMPRIIYAATNVIVAFINGISQNLPRVIQAGFNLIINFLNGIANAINANSGRMRQAGMNIAFAIADGMSGGLASKAGELANKARNMVAGALDSAKSYLGIHSPSRKFFEVGEYSMQGFINGIDSYETDVRDSSTNMAETAMRSLKDAISQIDFEAIANEELNPVITPVLDLTDIQSGINTMGGMIRGNGFSVSSAYDAATSIMSDYDALKSETPTTSTSSPTKVEFNQYNSSPKALSEGDIYRQTNNQISFLANAFTRT